MKNPLAVPWQKLALEFQHRVFRIDFGLYLVKCLAGASICYGFYLYFPGVQFSWSIVSVLLVLAPDYHDSVKLALDRIKANLIGASIGLGTFLLRPPDLLSLASSILATILFCTFFQLGNASRTALAALIIVLIQEKERNDWNLGLQRMVAVVVGSLVALILTIALRRFHEKTKKARPHPPEGSDGKGASE
jgi:uncharacterized membrane protein YgaE (UPF0421/DUF939 family)